MGDVQIMATQSSVEYWDIRYRKDKEPFEWLQRPDGVKALLESVVQPDHKVLVVGAGNSGLSEDLYHDAEDITNIDFSEECVTQMKAKHSEFPNMKWQKMDVTSMSFPPETSTSS